MVQLFLGRDDWIRTSDPTHPMRVRYQTAPHPDDVFWAVVVHVRYRSEQCSECHIPITAYHCEMKSKNN